MIEQGRLDVTNNSPPPNKLSQLATRYPSQLHHAVLPKAFGFALNTQVLPFKDLGVRKALNYAVDRSTLVRLSGGPQLAQVSCQILPPDFPGYQPYCPYTLNPSASGTWSQPNHRLAQQLVNASGTGGARITVWTMDIFPAKSAGGYLVSVLNSLGYHAHLKAVKVVPSPDRYFKKLKNPHLQISFFPWLADYPAPSGILVPLFACQSKAGRHEHVVFL